jgi:hypothetical protein
MSDAVSSWALTNEAWFPSQAIQCSTCDGVTLGKDSLLVLQSSVVTSVFPFFYASTSPGGPWPPHYRGFTITLRHTALGRTPLDEWSARRRDIWLKIHNNQKRQTDIHAPGEIRTHNCRKRAAADPRLWPYDHWNLYHLLHSHLFVCHRHNFTNWQHHYIKYSCQSNSALRHEAGSCYHKHQRSEPISSAINVLVLSPGLLGWSYLSPPFSIVFCSTNSPCLSVGLDINRNNVTTETLAL